MNRRLLLMPFFLSIILAGGLPVRAESGVPYSHYDIGAPVLTDIYVSPSGSDDNPGNKREQPLQTIEAAWGRIPMGVALETGYHIWLLPGQYAAEDVPGFWESRYGTFEHPIILEAADGPDTVYLPNLNIYDSHYFYVINVNIEPGADAFHCELCDHLLVRGTHMVGAEPETYNAQETAKVNQSQYVYFEDNDISGAWDNAVDFVAVQYGHFFNNHIHNAGDWCMYLKGGSAYFRVEGNEFYDCGVGGFTAGQGTGYQFMSEPWLQYEAYDIKFVNNLIHDTDGAGIGVQGGYNILIAFNTLYRVGERSHVLEFGFGSRSCDGAAGEEGRERCDSYTAAGGWGNNAAADGTNFVRIPNRNVYVYNNLIYNPAGYQSAYQHFSVFAAYDDAATQINSNVPAPVRVDDNLQIRGNLIWNGGAEMPLGIEGGDSPAGCQADNPTCNEAQLRAENAINTFEPQLIDPANGNYSPSEGVGRLTVTILPIPDFTWDVPVAAGDVSNAVSERMIPGADVSGMTANPSLVNAAPTQQAVESTPITAETIVIAPTAVSVINAQPMSVLPPGSIALVTLGDSLTEGAEDEREAGGYPGRLIGMIDALRPGSTLLNVGHSGWNSDALINGDQGLPSELTQALEAVSAAKAAGQHPVALVWIGSNDLFYLYEYNNPDAAAEQADLDNYAHNLDTILGQLTSAGAKVVIALLDDQSLRPVTQNGGAFPGTSRDEIGLMAGQIARYNTVIAQKAAEYDALMVDFYRTTIFTDAATLAGDGNHPNAAGYDAAAGLWYDALSPLVGG